MVDDTDGKAKRALELTQEREHGRDLRRRVLIDAVQAHERIQHHEERSDVLDRGLQLCAILHQVQPQPRGGDDMDGEVVECDLGRAAEALQPCPHQMQRVFGGVEQHRSAPRRGKPAQTRDAAGDGDEHVEGEKALAALRLTANDADRFVRP
jgi:hypothetical protein